MKKIILFSAIGISCLSSAFIPVKEQQVVTKQTTSATLAGDFAFLRAHRQGRGITVTWGMANNTNLIGFDIEKTMEDPNDPYSVWTLVTSVPGSGDRSYKITDNTVSPGISNYKVTAWYSDGRSATSDIVSVRIVGH